MNTEPSLDHYLGGSQHCLTLEKANDILPQNPNPSYCVLLISKAKDASEHNHLYSALH